GAGGSARRDQRDAHGRRSRPRDHDRLRLPDRRRGAAPPGEPRRPLPRRQALCRPGAAHPDDDQRARGCPAAAAAAGRLTHKRGTSSMHFGNPLLLADIVRAALAEDLGRTGDITSAACIPADRRARAQLVARRDGRLAGLEAAEAAFRLMDGGIRFTAHRQDGEALRAGDALATVEGPARTILAAERVALNFVGRLSGIATLTAAYVAEVAHTRARICDTRKTTPGLRALEKYAVACGGGLNHRFGLDDAILIKDNHIAVAGGVRPALRAAKAAAGHLVKIEIEVDTLEQLAEVIEEGADVVMLDNMPPAMLAEAVAMVGGRMRTEASGGVDLSTVRAIAETGVDAISVGALTHSAPVLDIGLDIAVDGAG